MNRNEVRSANVSQEAQEHDGKSTSLAVARETVNAGQRALYRLLKTYEQNRKLVAYEIHDGLVQSMNEALSSLEASMRVIGDRLPAAAQEGLDRTSQLLRHGIAEARGLMNGLRPDLLDDVGIVAALDHLVREARRGTNAAIEWSHRGDFDGLAPPLESAVFRVIQESLTNALRHSGSTSIRIALSRSAEQIHILVEDRGRGFAHQEISQNQFGVQGIRKRAEVFGGQAIIDSAPGRGTRIVVRLPFVET